MRNAEFDDANSAIEIDRVDVGLRILDSILFAILFSLVETLVSAVVIFQLGYALVTERAPSARVRDLGNRLSTYAYQLLRYLTHNSAQRPFPFSDFPDAIEAVGWPYAQSHEDATTNDGSPELL